MSWQIRSERGVITNDRSQLVFNQLDDARRQLAGLLAVQRDSGRRLELDGDRRVATVYDGYQRVDALWIEDARGQVAPLGL